MDLYFERHDQAVRCEDFVAAMEDATGVDLGQFRLWYSQSGTPELDVSLSHDADARTATLKVRQNLPPTPGQPVKEPMLIPFSIALLDPAGKELPLQLRGEYTTIAPDSRMLPVTEREQEFVFENVEEPPVPSLLRGFSAPVKVHSGLGRDEELFLFRYDSDPFARWDAGQRYLTRMLLDAAAEGRPSVLDSVFHDAVADILQDGSIESAFVAELLTLPGESVVADSMHPADPDAIHRVRVAARMEIGRNMRSCSKVFTTG